jgi:hypothetical protein
VGVGCGGRRHAKSVSGHPDVCQEILTGNLP